MAVSFHLSLEQEQLKLVTSIPMPHQDLRELFDHLDQESASGCDHTLRLTTEFLEKRGLDVERIVPWLREHGGSQSGDRRSRLRVRLERRRARALRRAARHWWRTEHGE